uniref:Uncharacterized protein n=1 Tax=Cacopsylla melanoneura TaxID=428564 RepID=A0A8D8W8R7_9HEMI
MFWGVHILRVLFRNSPCLPCRYLRFTCTYNSSLSVCLYPIVPIPMHLLAPLSSLFGTRICCFAVLPVLDFATGCGMLILSVDKTVSRYCFLSKIENVYNCITGQWTPIRYLLIDTT